MGRESKILLGLLGTLSLVFLAALLAKLFIARPPDGAGVDVHADVARLEPHALVEPPEPGRPRMSAFAAAAAVESAPPSGEIAEEPVTAGFEPPADERVEQASLQLPAEPEAAAETATPLADATAAGAEGVARPEIRPGSVRIVEPGDTWWSIAEAAYGDGRFYRALYAWNRAIDPTVAAAAGRRVEVPTREQLLAAHPGAVPAAPSRARF